MTTDELKKKLLDAFPGAQIAVSDLTGGGDHFRAEIVSAAFGGKSVVEQHRMVYAALGEEMKGPIHALQLVTRAG
jgi:stress-induced morphogen